MRELLNHLAGEGTFSHAYVIEGIKEGAKAVIARDFAVSICQEEVISVSAGSHSLGSKSLEKTLNRLAIKPFKGDRNVAIIEDADMMTTVAQNRLLKTLEDPPGKSVIILLSENIENLLPTVLSRCVVFRLDEEIDWESEKADYYKDIANQVGIMVMRRKPFYRLNSLLAEMAKSRDDARNFLDALEIWFRDLLFNSIEGLGLKNTMEPLLAHELNKEIIYYAVTLIEEARRDLSRFTNSGYTLKSLALKLTV
ncbi:MAG: hypothetical protein ACOX4U_02210 [Anaerovoracaceae bacterium]